MQSLETFQHISLQLINHCNFCAYNILNQESETAQCAQKPLMPIFYMLHLKAVSHNNHTGWFDVSKHNQLCGITVRIGLLTKWSWVRIPGRLLSSNNSRQVVHTHVPLSQSSREMSTLPMLQSGMAPFTFFKGNQPVKNTDSKSDSKKCPYGKYVNQSPAVYVDHSFLLRQTTQCIDPLVFPQVRPIHRYILVSRIQTLCS